MKSLFKECEFPHVDVKNLKNASGSPEIGTACDGASARKIRSDPGGESPADDWVGDWLTFYL